MVFCPHHFGLQRNSIPNKTIVSHIQRGARYSKKVSYYKIMLLAKISILLQDTISRKEKYHITRY